VIGALNAQQHILQHLRVDLRILWEGGLQFGQLGLLLLVAGADALPALPPRCHQLRRCSSAQL
jgi:hypothetical protein